MSVQTQPNLSQIRKDGATSRNMKEKTGQKQNATGHWRETQRLNLFDRGIANDQKRIRERRFWLVRKGKRLTTMLHKLPAEEPRPAQDHDLAQEIEAEVLSKEAEIAKTNKHSRHTTPDSAAENTATMEAVMKIFLPRVRSAKAKTCLGTCQSSQCREHWRHR